MNKTIEFFREVKREAKNITWATKKEVVSHALVVCVIALIMAFFFFLVDFVVIEIVQLITGLGR